LSGDDSPESFRGYNALATLQPRSVTPADGLKWTPMGGVTDPGYKRMLRRFEHA
jgi:hypothetical protein